MDREGLLASSGAAIPRASRGSNQPDLRHWAPYRLVPNDTDLLAILAEIGEDVKRESSSRGKRTRNKILAAAKAFGPLDRGDNSLTAWARTALDVHANLEAIWTLSDCRTSDPDGGPPVSREYLASESGGWRTISIGSGGRTHASQALLEPEGGGEMGVAVATTCFHLTRPRG